jgi:hypothetical protein
MLPAPNVETLLAFEEPLELAFVSILSTRAGIANVFPSRSTDTAESPWVEVSLVTNDPIRKKVHELGPEQAGTVSPDGWTAQLDFKITTQRNTNGSLHKVYIGRIRDWIRLRRVNPIWDVTSYYRISGFEGGACKKLSDDDNNLDITIMTYTLVFGIHPDAWPLDS